MMNRKYFLISLIVLIFTAGIGLVYWDLNRVHSFRKISSDVPVKRQAHEQCHKINPTGLNELNAYGSGNLDLDLLKSVIEKEPNKFYIINLLQIPTYYFKSRNLRWYGIGYLPNRGFFETKKSVRQRLMYKFRKMLRGFPTELNDQSITIFQSEKQVVESLGAHFYTPQMDEDWLVETGYIDELVEFFKQLPNDAKLYFHCSHGKGRTTTFLILYDMFKNASKVSLKDFVNRHYCIGGEDVFNTEVWKDGTWTKRSLERRKELVENFYDYMTDPNGYPNTAWSKWNQERLAKNKDGKINFKNGENSQYLIYGWSVPSKAGRWSDGEKAAIELPLSKEPSSSLKLEIEGEVLLFNKASKQEVKIFVNKSYVQTLKYNIYTNGTNTIDIPKDIAKLNPGKLLIEFNFKNIKSQKEVGLNNDQRKLGLCIESILVQEVPK